MATEVFDLGADGLAFIRRQLTESAQLKLLVADALAGDIAEAARLLIGTLAAGGKVLLFGNGGSAADAQHIAAELVGTFGKDRKALPCLALTTDSSILTAWSNDRGYEEVFARQVEALGGPGDLAVAISTSANSANVVAGVRAAKEIGMRTLGLLGSGGGVLAPMVDVALIIPSSDTPRIQEMHITVGHILCALAEEALFS